MTKSYTMSIGDEGGLFDEKSFETCEELAAAARTAAEKYPRKAICFSNSECCDYECDGITEDERDLLDEAVFEGHKAVKAVR
jgi:hypothetical protein